MRAARRLLAGAALVAALATSACRRGGSPPPSAPPPRPALGAITLENLSPPSQERIDTAKIESDVRQALAGSGLFAPAGADAGSGPTARARLAFTAECVELGAKGEARAQVRLRVDTRPSDVPGAVAFDLGGQGVEPYAVPSADNGTLKGSRTPRDGLARGDPALPHAPAARKAKAGDAGTPPRMPSLTALVVRITRDLVEGVAARRRLQDGSPAALHAALAADAGELREEAIRIIGERQVRDEVPTLLKLLSDNDETVRDAALGALIAMRERRAVRELTESRSLRDRREMRKIIEAISILGGQEADEYLSFVAATHDDDEIRAEAAAARARLQRRQAEAGAAP